MSPSSDLQIDEIILSVTEASWSKVAFVIIKVTDKMGSDLPEGDAGYNLVAISNEVGRGKSFFCGVGLLRKHPYTSF
ncbi:MAG: hypothetical protein WBL50_26790 [Candidatus Acidiferrum sp.]